MENKSEILMGNALWITAQYLDENGNPYSGMIGLYRVNTFSIERNKNVYKIEVRTVDNLKEVTIAADRQINSEAMYSIFIDIMSFENLFDGRFFLLSSYKIDGTEYLTQVRKCILSYFESIQSYTIIDINYSDKEYQKTFVLWTELKEQLSIIHQLYLYAIHTNGITTDVRMALLLQIFEPLSEMLHDEGRIVLVPEPYKIYSNTCSACGHLVTRVQPNYRLYLADRVKSIIEKYGKEIFDGDSQVEVIKRAVAVRNRVTHVKINKDAIMNGSQCGFYLNKFSLLYRLIIFEKIGMNIVDLGPEIMLKIENYNKKFPQSRIV